MDLYGKCGLCADGLPCGDHQRNADDVIAAMERTRSMQPVSKDDAWILADALLELRHEVTEERQQARFAAEEAASRVLEGELRPGYCAKHDTPIGFAQRPVCPHCAP